MSQSYEPEKAIAAELRLRADPPRVVRLSRKALVILGGGGAVVVCAAVAFALRDAPGRTAKPEPVATNAKATADALAALPKDYGGLPPGTPRLGPPLPGDLGRPILAAQAEQGEASPVVGPVAPPVVDPARQQADPARQAARTSGLFLTARPGTSPVAASAVPGVEAPPVIVAGGEGAEAKVGFLEKPADTETVSRHRLEAPASPYLLQAGSVVAAALVTGVRSDLPGQVTAQVTQNIYDSATGRILLIPQGAKLIGLYDSEVAFGQNRVLLAWTRLILPSGRSIVLDRQPAGDVQGFSGLQDRVDHHLKALAFASVVSTLLGVGTQLGSGSDDSEVVHALRQGGASAANQVGQQVIGKSLDIPPTLTVRPGYPVRVLITRDLVLEPYRR